MYHNNMQHVIAILTLSRSNHVTIATVLCSIIILVVFKKFDVGVFTEIVKNNLLEMKLKLAITIIY